MVTLYKIKVFGFIAWSPNKIYIKIPYGEIQYGKISKKLTIWFKGKCY